MKPVLALGFSENRATGTARAITTGASSQPSWKEEGITMVGFKKILFPTDLSANADNALAHAIRLADFDNGEVIVQHVVGNYFEKHPHWATLFDLHEIQKYMDGYVAAHVTKMLPLDTRHVHVRSVI